MCFNFGESGHFSSGCSKPKVCFICLRSDHIVEDCSEWQSAHQSAQYLDSANRGLGFYHIDVAPKEGRLDIGLVWTTMECSLRKFGPVHLGLPRHDLHKENGMSRHDPNGRLYRASNLITMHGTTRYD